MKNILMLIVAALFLQGCASPKMSQELQGGKNLFEKGEYKDAFHELLPVAVHGNKEAQYAVGYMYFNGIGVAQDTESGTFWIAQSANQHYPPAEDAMKSINVKGRNY